MFFGVGEGFVFDDRFNLFLFQANKNPSMAAM